MFYTEMAKVYSAIFPSEKKVEFVAKHLDTPSKILDVGSADGRMALGLANLGHTVDGFDLSRAMVEVATKLCQDNSNVHIKLGNMLYSDTVFKDKTYDLVMCTGNTLVHLLDETSIDQAIASMLGALKVGGKLVIQILNYAYIYRENVTDFPVVDNDVVTFKRHYNLADNVITFKTELVVKENTQMFKEETKLFPLKKDVLLKMLTKHHLKHIEIYSGYDGSPFNAHKKPLIIVAQK